MKVFSMNEEETVVARNEEEAISFLKNILGVKITNEYTEDSFLTEYEIDIEEITDLENMYCFYGSEDEIDLYAIRKMAALRISFKELLDNHADEMPCHFTREF